MAHTIQTHELISFSIQDWTRGQRWGDAVAGDVEMDWTYGAGISRRRLEPLEPQGEAVPIGIILGAGRQVEGPLNHCFKNSSPRDFFNTLSHEQTFGDPHKY